MQNKEADIRPVVVADAIKMVDQLRGELFDYAALQEIPDKTVRIVGVNFQVDTLRQELVKRICATQNHLANMVKQL